MRPILVELPSKILFFAALVLAAVSFARDRMARKKDPKLPASTTPLYLLVAAALLMGLRGGGWLPTGALFSKPWLAVPVYSYGVMLGTSMIVGWFLAMRLAKEDGIAAEQAGVIYMWTAVWSIVGARILYIIANHDEFESAIDLFKVWKGGLVAYGGMIGGFLASWYCCWRRKIPLLRWADVAAPSVVLGTAITRVGCLLFGCDYGKRSDVAWAIQFPKDRPAWQDHVKNFQLPADAPLSFPVHPTQVYEMLVGLLIFGLMMYMRKVRRFSGQVFLTWVVGYGIGRPIIEAFRDDDQRGSVGPLSTSQFIGMMSAVLGVGLLVHLLRRYREDPAASRLWEQPLEVAPAPGAAAAAAAGGGSGGGGGGRRRKRR
jgi:phosphatidylglycerol---prolipoprotein diacylglyceryl transferase